MSEPSDRQPPTGADLTESASADHEYSDATTELTGTSQQRLTRLGRYVVQHPIGSGGFGTVVLARDTELDRLVAIKIPNPKRFRNARAVESFLAEAKMAARLRHDGIVTVFDVGWEKDTPFIVLDYIRGRTLAEFMHDETWTHDVGARLVMEVAQALNHAHAEGFIHRDLKPKNILLDGDDRPRISDFGLAVRQRDVVMDPGRLVGTPRYMAPEQAAGENHRIDERTDVWALGVILYQLLCRKHPFASDSQAELLGRIVRAEFTPPSSIDRSVPHELERICLRCLSRRMSQRYRYANDLARDLSVWLRDSDLEASEGSADSNDAREFLDGSAATEPAVVCRGLRPFKAEDSVFFTRLLPGPYDRNGLPITLNFWISRLRDGPADATSGVSLLYGPSGCGKSSFVRAAVIPHLPSITTLYVDATGADLEQRIAAKLRSRFGFLQTLDSVPQVFAELRETLAERVGGPEKVVIFIDQFEQWLAQDQTSIEDPLVQALRQCDGESLQCVLIVRDDFWLPVSRLMNLLETSVVDGENAMLIDSFAPDHARHVLTELGRSMRCLPLVDSEVTHSQREFLDRAIRELSEQGRLFPVRLAVFVELVRKLPWTVGTLESFGGIAGVGVSFLDHSVGRKATAARQVHMDAARRVLAELLPARGNIIKASVRRERLLEVSGYENAVRDFDSLMRILDSELRLLTPVLVRDADEEFDSQEFDSSDRQISAYQLTHDFLVPSIREWLERDLLGRRGGRQQLLLQEQAAMWADRRSTRYLPSMVEYIQLRLHTRSDRWTNEQSEMMRAAGKRIGRRAMAALAIVAFIAVGAWSLYIRGVREQRSLDAKRLLSTLQQVSSEDVPAVLDELQPLRTEAFPAALAIFEDRRQPISKRLRAGIYCLRSDPRPLAVTIGWLTDEQLRPRDVSIVADELLLHRAAAVPLLEERLLDKRLHSESRLRIAATLAQLQPGATALESMGEELIAVLIRQPLTEAQVWLQMLQPMKQWLVAPVRAEFRQELDLQSARVLVAALEQYVDSPQNLLPQLVGSSKLPQLRAIIESRYGQTDELRTWIRDYDDFPTDPEQRGEVIVNLAVASLLLGDATAFREIAERRHSPLRTKLIAKLSPDCLDLWRLTELAEPYRDEPTLRSVFVLAAGAFHERPISLLQRERLNDLLIVAAEDPASAESHVAATSLLKRWQFERQPVAPQPLRLQDLPVERAWFVDAAGQEMAIVPIESGPEWSDYRVAIGVTEVPGGLVREFSTEMKIRFSLSGVDDRLPAHSIPISSIHAFCNWLSKREGLPPEQWCYQLDESENGKELKPKLEILSKTGYRLLTKTEWITATGGSETNWLTGCTPATARPYCWDRNSAEMFLKPVGDRLPNPHGLIDLFGNVSEICLDFPALQRGEVANVYCAMGGSALTQPAEFVAGENEQRLHPKVLDAYLGFRVARTVPSSE